MLKYLLLKKAQEPEPRWLPSSGYAIGKRGYGDSEPRRPPMQSGNHNLAKKVSADVFNHNVCIHCSDKIESLALHDISICGICGARADCFDSDLIGLYKGLGFSDLFIHRHLPRLRQYMNHRLSIADIGRMVSEHITVIGQDAQPGDA